jgi:hypothetical protein
MRSKFKYILIASLTMFAANNAAFAQQSLENTLRQQDPAALRQLQSATPTLEKMGVNIQNLQERNSEQEIQKMERNTESKLPDKGRRAYGEAKDFVKDPNISESKQAPTGLHVPIYRGNDTTYMRTDLKLSVLPDSDDGTENLMILATESPATIISWYRTVFKSDGWRTTESPASPMAKGYSSGGFEAEKNGWKCRIQIFGRSAGKLGTQVSVMATPTDKGE